MGRGRSVAGVVSAPRVVMRAATARAMAFGNTSSGDAASGWPRHRGGGVAAMRGRPCARRARSPRRPTVHARPAALDRPRRGPVRRCGQRHAAGRRRANAALPRAAPCAVIRTASSSTGFGCLVSLSMTIAGLGEQLVEQRSALGRHTTTNGDSVGFVDVDMCSRAEQGRQLKCRDLPQCGSIDVVAGNGAPTCAGRATTPPAARASAPTARTSSTDLNDAATPLSWMACATGRRRCAVSSVPGQAPMSRPAASFTSIPHLWAVGEQVAGRHQVGAVGGQVPRGRRLEVRQGTRNVFGQLDLVQVAEVDRLQR